MLREGERRLGERCFRQSVGGVACQGKGHICGESGARRTSEEGCLEASKDDFLGIQKSRLKLLFGKQKKQPVDLQSTTPELAKTSDGEGSGLHSYLFDVAGQGHQMEGPACNIIGSRWVSYIKGLSTDGSDGQIFLFDEAGKGRQLEGHTSDIRDALWVSDVKAFITYGGSGQKLLFDVTGKGRHFEGLAYDISVALWVSEIKGLIAYSRGGQFSIR